MNVRTARGEGETLRSHWWHTLRLRADDPGARERRRRGLIVLAILFAVVDVGGLGYLIGHGTGVGAPVSDALRNQAYQTSSEQARTGAVGGGEQAGQRAGDRAGLLAGRAAGARAGQRRGSLAVQRERAAVAKRRAIANRRARAAAAAPPASASAEEVSALAAPPPAPTPAPAPAPAPTAAPAPSPAPAPSQPAKPPCFDAAGRPC